MVQDDQIFLTTAKELLTLLGIEAKISLHEEDEGVVLEIDNEESGILIGYHGETLQALQIILSQLVYKKTGEWQKFTIDVGGYLQGRKEQLYNMADRAVDQVRATGKSQSLPYLSAKERRLIHTYLSQVEGIKTESIGEDEARRLVVFPQS
ncbi:KH domain-containing protein [Candidatus Beckwithbacteria bacterium]|nr:KH domain-containing protein [Candidatus Beckwithbacteria bacterium]